jgi:hypothetical protein
MNGKKPYIPPQLYEVVLDQEQAILATCSLATMATSAGGTVGCRPPDVATILGQAPLAASARCCRPPIWDARATIPVLAHLRR